MSAARSKLQQTVLSLYRDFLRASKHLDPSIKTHIKEEFRAQASRFSSKDTFLIEYHLRRAQRQLTQLKSGQITQFSKITVERKE